MRLTSLSIAALQRALQQGEIAAAEIARHTLAAIEQHNPALNAWTAITGQRMLREAEELDRQRLRGGTLPPLAGIPYAVKNLFDVAGHTTLAGASLFSTRAAARTDAWAVNRMRESGALLSGMLNMDAYAYGFTTENSHYGATCNPRDVTRIAGGSSGGSAAAVAAGLVHFSLGSDTNGSISGTQPFVASLDHIGPFARSVEDLSLVYDALQGRDAGDAFQLTRPPEPVSDRLQAGSDGLRCAALGGFFTTWCDDEARSAVARVARALQAEEEVVMPQAELARAAAFIITAVEGGSHYLPALRSQPEQFEPHSRERLLAGAMLPAAWYTQAQRFRRGFQQQVLSLFTHYDVLLAPATPCSATLIGQQNITLNGESLSARATMGAAAAGPDVRSTDSDG